MMDGIFDVKQRMQELWKFASDHEKVNEHAHTPEYKAGVQDAIDRLEYLWYCHKHGPGDPDTWIAMDAINEGRELVKLLLDQPPEKVCSRNFLVKNFFGRPFFEN